MPAWYVCQVFYHTDNINNWKVTLAFCHKKKFDVSYSGIFLNLLLYLIPQLSEMKNFYQDAEIGPVYDIQLKIKMGAIKVQEADGLEVVSSSQVHDLYTY